MKHVVLAVALLGILALGEAAARQPLTALSPPEGGRAYRLNAISYRGESTVVTVLVDATGRAQVETTLRRHPRPTAAQIQQLDAALASAGFDNLPPDPPPSTLPLGAAGACPGFPTWSLEAVSNQRRHVVRGTACDRRGLKTAVNLMLRLGGAPPWP